VQEPEEVEEADQVHHRSIDMEALVVAVVEPMVLPEILHQPMVVPVALQELLPLMVVVAQVEQTLLQMVRLHPVIQVALEE
jgi:hypothetical protein